MEYQLNHGFRTPDERSFTDHHLVELARRHYPAVQAKLLTSHEEKNGFRLCPIGVLRQVTARPHP